jgi:hypothetical protein
MINIFPVVPTYFESQEGNQVLQKARIHKALNRRRYSRKAANKNDNLQPLRKISETLLDFAQPFIEMIDESTTKKDIENGLIIAITVWNSKVF